MGTLLRVKNLTHYFGKLAAVNNLSFEVKKGEVFGIAGPNGAGKTTLFNLITGFYWGTGEIIFNGENINNLKPYQVCHKGIARTFQIPNLFSSMTVFQNVDIAARFGQADNQNRVEKIAEAISYVGLGENEHTNVEHLPLYQKKLTMLAMILATSPQLILLDEPIGGLSPVEVNESIRLIKKINEELNITIIIIEHLMRVLTELSSKMMILQNGEKICVGIPDEVVQNEKVIEVYLGG